MRRRARPRKASRVWTNKSAAAKPDEPERVRKDLASAREELEKRLAAERDPLVRQDLEILIAQANRDIRSSEASGA